MTRLVVVELEKLRTVRSSWILFACGVLIPLPFAVLVLVQSRSLAQGPEDVLGLVAFPAIFAACLGALNCAREFEHRTIALAFTLEPRRERVIAAKALAVAIVGIAMAMLACTFALSLAAIWLWSAGVPWPWTAGETAQGLLGAVGFVAAGSIAGTGFGALTRHVGGAITLLLGIYIVAEAILSNVLGVWRDYGPTAAAAALMEPSRPHPLAFVAAFVLVFAISLAYLAGGIGVVRRADV